MGNRKRSAVDRLPVDYAEPRRQEIVQGNDFGAMLALTPLTEQERAARTERALAVLRAYGAEDLAEALELTGDVETAPIGRSKVRIIDAPCSRCKAQPGQMCTSGRSTAEVAYHGARRRRHAEMQQEAA